jgi:hypothetical protein
MRVLSWFAAFLAVTTVEVEGSFYDNPKVEQPPEGGTPIEELKAKWGSDVSSTCYSDHTVERTFHAIEQGPCFPDPPPPPRRYCLFPDTEGNVVPAFATSHLSL